MRKRLQLIALMFVITILSNIITATVMGSQTNKRIYQAESRIIDKLENRFYLDSLQMDHWQHCSFISKEEIRTDNRGYLYSIYKQNPLLTENK